MASLQPPWFSSLRVLSPATTFKFNPPKLCCAVSPDSAESSEPSTSNDAPQNPVDPVKLAFSKAKAYKESIKSNDNSVKPGSDVDGGQNDLPPSLKIAMEKAKKYKQNKGIAVSESETTQVQGRSEGTSAKNVTDNTVGKKGDLSVSRMDFVGLDFADKKSTRGLPPGLVPISDPFFDDDLPEVELIVGDTSMFDAAATAPKPEQTKEDESELYKPKVSTWGVFPRPSNISKTFGGGRVIRPGEVLETEEEKAVKEARTKKVLADYKKKIGLNIDPKLKSECKEALEDGDSLMSAGKLKEALPYYEKVMDKLAFESELHGLAALQWSICQDSLSRSNEARSMYEKLQSHPNAKVSKKARQFMYSFQCTVDGRLQNLFWADGNSRADFNCFGDVIAFDATYKKNRYNNPLIIFSGKNHHSETVIFACAMVGDETVETYKWVFETFLVCMCNKHPAAVVTDGDGAMREAIRQVFPNAIHRLCAWHLNKNATENVKNKKFLEDFQTAMYSNFTVEQFESFWEEMVVEHKVQGNKWVKKTYEKKSLWATAYLRDKFFACIRTTSQCEGVNSLIKAYVRSKNSIIEFLHNFEQSVRQYRYNELNSDFVSFYTKPVLTTSLKEIESQASKIFTLNIFKEVRCEIEKAGTFNVIERSYDGEKVVFKLNEWCKPRSEHRVVYDKEEDKLLCDCQLFEYCGIPCAHIFCVMRLQHMDSIPASLICNRWKKDAKSGIISSDGFDRVDADMMEVARFVELVGVCNKLCQLAAKKREHFNDTRSVLVKLIKNLQSTGNRHTIDVDADGVNFVHDPTVVKSKGAPVKKKHNRKRKRCSYCNRTGHIIRTCPKALGTEDKQNRQDDSSSAESEDNRRPAESNNENLSPQLHVDNDSQLHCGSSNCQKKKEGSKHTTKKVDKKVSLSESSNKESDFKLRRPSMVPPFQSGSFVPNASAFTNIAQGVNVTPPSHRNPVQNAFGTFAHGVSIVPPIHHTPVSPFGEGVGVYYHPLYSTNILQRPYFHNGVSNVSRQGVNNFGGAWTNLIQQVMQNGVGTNGSVDRQP